MKTVLRLLPLLFFFFAFTACKHKKTDYFPVLPFINSQVQQVDTSIYTIMKIERMDTDSVYDTSYIHRDQFRAAAHDFLETPDITSYSLGKKYKEDRNYDDKMNRIMLTYTALKDNLEVVRQELVVIPDEYNGTGNIKSVIIEKMKEGKDSTIHQRLLWLADEKFQVVNIIEKNGTPVYTKITEVIWNEQKE